MEEVINETRAKIVGLKDELSAKLERTNSIQNEFEREVNVYQNDVNNIISSRDKTLEDITKAEELISPLDLNNKNNINFDELREETNNKAQAKINEVVDKIKIKYEDLINNVKVGNIEQKIENFDIPEKEVKIEESVDLTNTEEVVNQEIESVDVVEQPIEEDNDKAEAVDNQELINNEIEENVSIQDNSEPTVVNEFNADDIVAPNESETINFDLPSEDARVQDVNEEVNLIETGEPILVTAVEPLGNDLEVSNNNEVQDINNVTEVNNGDAFVGSLPDKVFDKQQEQVNEIHSDFNDVSDTHKNSLTEEPVSNVEISSGFTDIYDSIEQSNPTLQRTK